jgi:NAD(P)H-hydrate repair Nnr-like enzyme with NAD(P)H-hydrate epimerase domain
MFSPTARSPNTGYQVLYPPRDILSNTMRGLAVSYPEERRLDALIDFAEAAGLSPTGREKLRQLIADEKEAAERVAVAQSAPSGSKKDEGKIMEQAERTGP